MTDFEQNFKQKILEWVRIIKRILDKENAELKDKLDAYQMSENEAQKIIAELKAYKDVNEDFKTAWEELKAENERLKEENKLIRQLHKDLSDKLFEFQKIEDTLQEIKAIAKNAYENESKYQATGVYNEIIQKITEAEEV